MPENQAYAGFAEPADMASDFTAMKFMIDQAINQTWTAHPVKVVGVTGGAGALAVAGTVDILPLVNQIDGAGTPTPHGTIFGVQYLRAQGGLMGVILDPAIGDIGWAVFASHDISSVVKNKGQANPGSRRRFSPSDALYLGGLLNSLVTTFIQFMSGNINITTPSGKTITVTGGTVNVVATHVTVTSNDVNLGASGGAAVARVGDTVSGGVITSGSSKVKSA